MFKRYVPEVVNVIKGAILLLLVLLQIGVLFLVIQAVNDLIVYAYVIAEIISFLILSQILASSKEYIYKLSWTVFLITLPAISIVFYSIYGKPRFIKKMKKKDKEVETKYNLGFGLSEKVDEIEDEDIKNEINSLYKLSSYPVYSNAHVEYFKLGEDFFKSVIGDLKKAEDFILIEFYIIAKGELYSEIKEILFQKAKEGVEIFIVYDKLGSMGRFNTKMENELKDRGIKIIAFNASIRSLYTFINYRTHRKLIVIDGKKGYVGGNNIADEYVNKIEKYGHWKDMGLKVEGEGVISLVQMFFKTWIMLTKEEINIDKYKVSHKVNGISYVVPFCDGPINDLKVGKYNYMKIISNAKKYVYITTPYLIIGDELLTTLKLSAISGVDVRILVPGIADKKMVYQVTKANFYELALAGVKIYTYTPGFVHGKVIVSDDKVSCVGSINFDFRSLLWNYENAVYVYDSKIACDIKEDYEEMLSKSFEVELSSIENRNIVVKTINGFLKVISPLL